MFGIPDGEHCEFVLVTKKPWSGFNTYLGGLRSRVDINTDLPVLSLSLPHLVAHEAYPGHHTEHSRKEVGLVRNKKWLEETIFLVGTPQCLIAEGLADLGLQVVMGPHHQKIAAEHFSSLGIRYDADTASVVAEASVVLQAVRATAAWRLHQEGVAPEEVVSELSRWALLPRPRAEKAVEFLDPPDLAGVHHLLCRGVRALPQLRRVRSDPFRPSHRRAAGTRRPTGGVARTAARCFLNRRPRPNSS